MEVDPEHSAIMRQRFGVNWRSWASFREQWTKLSLAAIAGSWAIIVAIGGWAATLKTRVIVLETQVAPILRETKVESNNASRLDDLNRRVTRLEDNIDLKLNEEARAAAKRASESGAKQ